MQQESISMVAVYKMVASHIVAKRIEIVNTNSWTDGGVASPAPFYWSTGGYAAMPYTFAPGAYDFGVRIRTR